MSDSTRQNPQWFPLQEVSPEEEERLRNFVLGDDDSDDEAEPYENESDFDDDVADPDFVLDEDERDDDDEEESDEGEEEAMVEPAIEPNRGQKYIGQGKGDKTVWWSLPSQSEKDRTEQMRQARKQAFPYVKENFEDKKKIFMRLFPVQIVGQIVIETNRKAKKVYGDNLRSAQPKSMRKWRDTNVDEVYAYIAILLHSGAEKANHIHSIDLFDKSNMPFYRAVMSHTRFEQLSRFIRFDDSRTRMVRLKEDKLAPIRYVWEIFQKNLTWAYVPSFELCVDEQLLTTRNRCSFRQYMPSKPGKYGVKTYWLVDAKTNFPLAAEIYLGQQPKQKRSTGVAHSLVIRLMKDYLYLGANLTMDNFFTSYKLANELMAKNTTITGTIKPNKRELPAVFTSAEEAKKRGQGSSVFCFSKSCELVSYTTNTNKNVLLLSTAHASEEMNEDTGKPIIIHDYNSYKGGVDTFDQMLRHYSCKRCCYRWPMLIFFNMIDVAALAAFRLHELGNPQLNPNKRDKRKNFLNKLAQNYLEERSKRPNLPSVTKIAMDLIGFKPKEPVVVKRKMPDVQVKNHIICILSHYLSFT